MNFNSPVLKFTLGLFALFFALWLFRNTDPMGPTEKGLSDTPVKLELRGKTMGTTYHVVLSELPAGQTLAKLQNEIDQRLQEINQVMSTYLSDSELSRFNQSESTSWEPVSSELFALVERAQQLSKITKGAFDITVGPAVNLWHFGPQKTTQDRTVPYDDQIEQVQQVIGYTHLHLDSETSALKKDFAELYLDLSAIAKGYAVDEIVTLIQKHKAKIGCMVEIGGEIGTAGKRPDGSSWRIGIQAPDAAPGTLTSTLELTNLSMATSGDYFNFFVVEGKRYSHTIDPHTARPVTHNLTSSVVVTKSCADADAWATALLVLGPNQAYDIARQHDVAVMLFERTDSGITSRQTEAFKQSVAKEQ